MVEPNIHRWTISLLRAVLLPNGMSVELLDDCEDIMKGEDTLDL